MNEKELFIAALQMNRADRPAFLSRACGNDLVLRSRIEMLLEAHEQPGGMLDLPDLPRTFAGGTECARTEMDGNGRPRSDERPTEADAPDPRLGCGYDTEREETTVRPAWRPLIEATGSIIGPYKLLQKLGEGGMGAVYLAEQEKPVRRRVALKLIKPGMDSDHVIARFESERQALALMDHPSIARIFHAGTTEGGRPFFVMEPVDGLPITAFCDQARLSTKERLDLFITVCQAVQHAHQKGIIHRDLKPSNVLITLIDGKPVPKVIDFGVAKAIDQKLTERTMFTRFGAILGTLEYMSPEQAELSGLDIDTRTDIYSLGAMLYELLTGTTPLERDRLRTAAYVDILRRIREEDPPRPSTRLSGSGEHLASIAALRGTEASRLTRTVRGDLDWIVMKSLEKDRDLRYETANGFARDIQRFLADEAVKASPPTATYRLRKFIRRNRGPAVAASLVLLALLGGIIGTSFGLFQAENSRQEALAAQKAEGRLRKSAEASERQAIEASNEAKAILLFLQEKILSAGRPEGQSGGLGKDVTLRHALDAAAPEIRRAFRDRPIVEASLSRYVGDTYTYLAEFKQSLPFFERALELRRASLGNDHPDTLVSMQDLGDNYLDLGQEARALPLFEEMKRRRTTTLGPDHELTLHVDMLLARLHLMTEDVKSFLPILERSMERLRTNYGLDAESTRRCMAMLGQAYISAEWRFLSP